MLQLKENQMAEQKCRECGHGNAAAALFCDRCGRALHAQDRDPLVGKTIGERYHLLECIGAGTAGVLYRAEHVTLRRRIALKLLHKHLAQSDDAVERFRREATTVCEIDNEHIPQVFDFGRSEDGRLFFAMEFLEGETLAQQLAKAPKGQLPIERVTDLLSQIADGLIDAHTLGYVHRDLRPRSIFLTKRRGRSDFVKLLDFGLAKLVQPEVDAQRTAMGMTYGDPQRMAPEQARGDQVDRRADIYSLGALGFEMLTGEPPYTGSGTFEILGRVLDAPVPGVRDRRPDCPPWLESLVRVALHKAPGDRFQTVTQLLDALERKQVLPGAPPLPGAPRVAVPNSAAAGVAGSAKAASPAVFASPTRPVATELEPMSQMSKGPQSTLAMPTVAPAPKPTAPAAPETGRATMSYPAVKPVRPATFGVGGKPAGATQPSASATPSSDDLRLLAERVPAAPSPAASKPAAVASKAAAAVKPGAGPAAPAASSAVKPGAGAASPKPTATAGKPAAAAPAKAVIIKPSLPSRSDPTPRTTAARIEQEAAGWLATAQTFFDEPTNEEALRGIKESAEAAEAANTLLGTTAGMATGEDIAGEDVPADPGDNDTLLSLQAPPAPAKAPAKAAASPASVKPAAAPTPVSPSPSKPTAVTAAKPGAAEAQAKPVAASLAPAAASPVAKPSVASAERGASVAKPATATAAAPAATVATVAPAAEPVRATPAGARADSEGAASPAPAAQPASTAWRSDSSAPGLPPAAGDGEVDADATLPRIKSTDDAPDAAPAEDDTIRHGKMAAANPTTAPMPKVAKVAIEADDSQPEADAESGRTPESGPPAGLNQAETAWFAKPATADGFAEDESYTVTRKKPPIWLYAGAAGLVLVGGLVLLSGGKKTTETPTPPAAVTTPSTNPSETTAAPSAGAGTPTAGSPTPVIVEPMPQTGKPAEPATGSAKPAEPATSAKPVEPTATPAPTAKPEPVAVAAAPIKPTVEALPPPAAKPPVAKPAAAEPAGKSPAPAAAKPVETKLAMAKPAAKEPAAAPARPAAKAAPAGDPTTAKPAAGGKSEEVAALIKLGKRRLDDGETDSAAGIFARAVDLDGNNAEALAGLGGAKYEQGEYEAAVRHLQKAARLAPRKTSTQETLADALFKAKRYKEAADTCRKLLKSDPGSAKAKQILERAEKQLGGGP